MASATKAPERSEPRGDRRRVILEAAVRVLEAEGLSGVTHRVVAREADTPLAATTYYFASKDQLLAEALELMAQAEIDRLSSHAAELSASLGGIDDLGRAIADFFAPRLSRDRRTAIAKYELYLEAARRPALRPVARRWIAAFTDLADAVLADLGIPEPADRAQMLVAGLDGIVIHELATAGASATAARLRARILSLVEAVTRS